jgi:hypothetical protein
MKAVTFYLTSLESISKASLFLLGCIPNGKVKVVFSDAGTKSAKQRGLQWRGYEDEAKSGIGGRLSDTEENCHLKAKYRFAIPIFLRDDTKFAALYIAFCSKYEDNEEMMLYFTDKHVSTEKFNTSQMAEYLTNYRNDCIRKGINLREPEFEGLLDFKTC